MSVLCNFVALLVPHVALVATQTISPTLAVIVYLVLFFVGAYYASVALGRFFLRAFPIRANGKRRPFVILALIVLIVGGMKGLIQGIGELQTSQALTTPLPVYILAIVSLAFPLVRHVRPRAALNRSFIFYLRRFSSFADRSVVAEILRAAPVGVPVAFLVGPAGERGSWDPLLISFSGTKWLRPFASSPIYLKSSDDEWETCVQSLIGRARCIVVDVTDLSQSIETEIDMTKKLKKDNEILWFAELSKAETQRPSSLPDRYVRYTRSWRQALPRMLLGFVLLVFIVAATAWTERSDAAFRAAIAGDTRAFPTLLSYLAFYSLIALPGWIPLFLRPSVSSAARREIHRALGTILERRAAASIGP